MWKPLHTAYPARVETPMVVQKVSVHRAVFRKLRRPVCYPCDKIRSTAALAPAAFISVVAWDAEACVAVGMSISISKSVVFCSIRVR